MVQVVTNTSVFETSLLLSSSTLPFSGQPFYQRRPKRLPATRKLNTKIPPRTYLVLQLTMKVSRREVRQLSGNAE